MTALQVNARRAARRRELVLGRLLELGLDEQRASAIKLHVQGLEPAHVSTMAGTHTACGRSVRNVDELALVFVLELAQLEQLRWCQQCANVVRAWAHVPAALRASMRRRTST